MTLLVKNVKIFGARKGAPLMGDIFVSGERVSAIGNFPPKKAGEIIDGLGMTACPGFIDVHSESDHYGSFLEAKEQLNFLRQGITTAIGGQDGLSLAPVLAARKEPLEGWSDLHRTNANWRTITEFLALMRRHPLGTNFGTLIGYGNIRRGLLGKRTGPLKKEEIEALPKALADLSETFGVSFNPNSVSESRASERELKIVLRELKSKIFSINAENGGEFLTDLRKIKKLVAGSRARILITDFYPLIGREQEYEEALAGFSDIFEDREVYFDIVPFGSRQIPIAYFLPAWLKKKDLVRTTKELDDSTVRARLKKSLPELDGDKIFVAKAFGHAAMTGRSLNEIGDSFSIADPKDGLIKLMMLTGCNASLIKEDINIPLLRKTFDHPRSLIVSRGVGVPPSHYRDRLLRRNNSFAAFLDYLKMMKEKDVLNENVIAKITSVPAKIFGIKDRGEIKEGSYADIVLMRDDEVRWVVVNGKVAVRDGELEPGQSGKILRSELR